MLQELTIATWNIAGGHTSTSDKQFDYSSEQDIEYFIQQLRLIQPDIVCLQESHSNNQVSLSKTIAEGLGMSYVFETINHPSHIDKEYSVSTAILSRQPFTNPSAFKLPYPQFEMKFKNGNTAAIHQRYLQTVNIGDFTIANTHTNNIEMFGYDYHKELGADFASELDEFFCNYLEKPLLFACDMNFTEASSVIPKLFSQLSLNDGLDANSPTRLTDVHSDYLLYSDDFTLVESKVITTRTDHYLGWAKFTYTPSN